MKPLVDEIMTDIVYRASVATLDEYGDPVPGTPLPVKCRIEMSESILSGTEGEKQNRTKIFSTEHFGVQDFVWLPGEDPNDGSRSSRPISVTVQRLESLIIYEVML